MRFAPRKTGSRTFSLLLIIFRGAEETKREVMRKIFLLSAVVMSLLFTSCNSSRELSANLFQTETQVVLSRRNYRIVKPVEGVSRQTKVMFFGGMSKRSFAESAVTQMVRNAELQGPQAIIHTTVHIKKQFYLFWWKRKAIANGLVIEFMD